MEFINDLHFQFTELVSDIELKPFAYLLSKRLAEGHICLDLSKVDLQSEYESWPEDIKSIIPCFLEDTLTKPTTMLSINPEDKKPFIVFNKKFYTYRNFNYENQIIEKIKAFISTENTQISKRQQELKNYKNEVLALQDINLEITDWQLAGCLNSYLNNFSIITGGPGTGKTTTIAKLIVVLYTANPTVKIALAAPTGKASIRMLESLKSNTLAEKEPLKSKIEELEASTIHRLLGYKKDSLYFRHNENNYLDFDVVIVDEASMIDVPLFAKLLGAINPSKQIILLGDKNQLSSVEAGSMFGDLCNSALSDNLSSLNLFTGDRLKFVNTFLNSKNQIPHTKSCNEKLLNSHITELILNRRTEGESKIIENFSKAILQEDVQKVKGLLSLDSDSLTADVHYSKDILEKFINHYVSYIIETDIKEAIEKLNNIRVLCAVREGKYGIYSLNKKIEAYLQKEKLLKINADDYDNRPILVTKNNKELNLFNGDVGILRKNSDGIRMAYFIDKNKEIRDILPSIIGAYETVFAMTIHKSQGSEFDNVLVVLPEKIEHRLLTKELLYTAITRAKKSVTIQGTEDTIINTVQTRVNRASGIIDRINN